MALHLGDNLLSVGTPSPGTGLNQFYVHGSSPVMRAVERTIRDIAPTEIPVLLVGESGTGKEVVALEIHRLSRRASEAFVKCGCATVVPEALLARIRPVEGSTETGWNGGSLFLDEISHLDTPSQDRLLHLLPDGAGNAPAGCPSMRVISSTTHNLEDAMRNAKFREELFYRISGVQLRLPPLRNRKEDIPELLGFFLKKYSSLFAKPEPPLAPGIMDLLVEHSWPGNIRELENVARKMVAFGDADLAIDDLATRIAPKISEPGTQPAPAEPLPVRSLKQAAREASRQAERGLILSQLERTHWNRKRTARELQISYKALLYKLKQLGLDGSGETK
jgi:two-component system response regulator AtoC